jgi:hypothetical protein
LLLILALLLGIVCSGLVFGTSPTGSPGTPFPGARTIVIPARATPTLAPPP